MALDKAMATAMRGIPDCVGACLLDLDTGELLASRASEDCPSAMLETAAAAVAALLSSGAATAIEQRFGTPREIGDLGLATQELAVFSRSQLQIFVRSRTNPAHLLCFICRRSANVGMALSRSRAALAPVTSAL